MSAALASNGELAAEPVWRLGTYGLFCEQDGRCPQLDHHQRLPKRDFHKVKTHPSLNEDVN